MSEVDMRQMVEHDLDELKKGYEGLLQQREEIEKALHRQIGGISYVQGLLDKMNTANGEPDATLDVSPSEQIDREAVSANVDGV